MTMMMMMTMIMMIMMMVMMVMMMMMMMMVVVEVVVVIVAVMMMMMMMMMMTMTTKVLYEKRESEFAKIERRREIILRIKGTLSKPWNQCLQVLALNELMSCEDFQF